MAEVTYDHVFKRYGNITVVNDFHVKIKDEEFVVLVGPSGCGKSTSLRMLAGLEEISDGTIRIGERVVNDIAPKDRDIAMVFQNYALYPHMNVFENMAFGLKLRHFAKADIDQRVKEAAKILGIESMLERKPKQLSGGQRQRVAVGRAIVRQPSVFLFDEPLSNLDAKLRVQMRAEISQLHERLRITTIYVTHDQVEAMTMGQRIVVMKDGFIHQEGPPLEIYERPVNIFVAGFIGSPQMNMFDGKLVTKGDDTWLESPTFKLKLTPQLAEAVKKAPAPETTFGIRPEDLRESTTEGEADDHSLHAEVTLVEPMGAETFLHIKTGETEMVARFSGYTKARLGQTIKLTVNMDKLHAFDPKSTLAYA